jgi:hypothetical protein
MGLIVFVLLVLVLIVESFDVEEVLMLGLCMLKWNNLVMVVDKIGDKIGGVEG